MKEINMKHLNMSLSHLKNLQEAYHESGLDIMYNAGVCGFTPVTIEIDVDNNDLKVIFKDLTDEKPESINLTDYTYIMSMFILE